ncbi:Glucan endo-1,3-beta-glucosidase A1 [Thalassocella blandensis]|nr:Glucan endo-1,3-beta-glucosidase A1 [Thalassocella blandensis]
MNRTIRLSKLSLITLISSLFIACMGDEIPLPPEGSGFEFVWNDEFNDTTLDSNTWNILIGDGTNYGTTPGWNRNEQTWYTEDNISIADGILTITAREENTEGYPYTSGKLNTRNKVSAKYGRLEAKIKTANGKGLWSAFELHSAEETFGPGAASGQINILEAAYQEDTKSNIFGSAHFGMSEPLQVISGAYAEVVPHEDFHEYAIEWDETEIRWYMDDVHYATVKKEDWWNYYYAGLEDGYISSEGAPFNQEFYIHLNLAVGGDWLGEPSSNTEFPAKMEIEYIRYFECPEENAPCISTRDDSVTQSTAELTTNTLDFYVNSPEELLLDEVVPLHIFSSGMQDDNARHSEIDIGGEHGTVIDFYTTDEAYFGLAAKFNGLEFFGIGNVERLEPGAGELKFDIYVDSTLTSPSTTLTFSFGNASAWSYKTLAISDLIPDAWNNISFPLNEFLFDPYSLPLDLTSVVEVLQVYSGSHTHIQIDNVRFTCGVPSYTNCGVQVGNTPPSPTPTPTATPIPTPDPSKPLVIFDDTLGTDIQLNLGVYDPDTEISSAIVDGGERGDILKLRKNGTLGIFEFNFKNGVVDLSPLYETGELIFDLFVENNVDATQMIIRMDSTWPYASDKIIDLPPEGEWTEVRISVKQLIDAGNPITDSPADIHAIYNPLVIDPLGNLTFLLDNIRFEGGTIEPTPTPTPTTKPTPNPNWPHNLLTDDLSGEYSIDYYDPENVMSHTITIDPDRGTILQVQKLGTVGNLAFNHQAEYIDLSAWYESGELVFDVRVDQETTTEQLIVRMDSGWPNVSELAVDLPQQTGEWMTVRLKVKDIVDAGNPLESGKADLSSLLHPVVFESYGPLSFSVSNLRFEIPFSIIKPELSAAYEIIGHQLNSDYGFYSYNPNNNISISLYHFDNEPDEVRIEKTGEVGNIAFALFNHALDLSEWIEEGELVFELRSDSYPLDTNMSVRMDSGWPNVSDYTIQIPTDIFTWETYRIKIKDIIASGNPYEPGTANPSYLMNPVVFENFSAQDFSIRNVRFEAPVVTPTPEPKPDLVLFADGINENYTFYEYDPYEILTFSIVEDESHGAILNINKADSLSGNLSFFAYNGFEDFSSWYERGDIVFDLRPESAPQGASLIIRMDSGWPNVSDYIISMPAIGTWSEIRVPVKDIIDRGNPYEPGQADPSQIMNPVVFEPLDIMEFSIDNLRFEEGTAEPTPTPSAPLILFKDEINPDYELEIYASDDNLFYQLVEDNEQGSVIKIEKLNGIANISFRFITGVIDFSNWYETADLVFDIRIDDQTDTQNMTVRMDSNWPNVSDATITLPREVGVWTEVRLNVKALIDAGNPYISGQANPSMIYRPLVLEPYGALNFSIDNVRFEPTQTNQ